jgi:hypothetical protein
VKAYAKWIEKVPGAYCEAVYQRTGSSAQNVETDLNCLAQLKDYRSLMPMAQEARKPMFALKPGDGAIGGHQAAVTDCYWDFSNLADRILRAVQQDSLMQA